jgi:tetratricopeptide (TPR) repeat protein
MMHPREDAAVARRLLAMIPDGPKTPMGQVARRLPNLLIHVWKARNGISLHDAQEIEEASRKSTSLVPLLLPACVAYLYAGNFALARALLDEYTTRVLPALSQLPSKNAPRGTTPAGAETIVERLFRTEILCHEIPPPLNEALSVVNGILTDDPENRFALDLKGRILHGLGRIDEAVDIWQASGCRDAHVAGMGSDHADTSRTNRHEYSSGGTDQQACGNALAIEVWQLQQSLQSPNTSERAAQALEQLASNAETPAHLRSAIRCPVLYSHYRATNDFNRALNQLLIGLRIPGAPVSAINDLAWELGNLVVTTCLDPATYTVRPYSRLNAEERQRIVELRRSLEMARGYISDTEAAYYLTARLARLYEFMGQAEAASKLMRDSPAGSTIAAQLAWLAYHWLPQKEIEKLANYGKLLEEADRIQLASRNGEQVDDVRLLLFARFLAGSMDICGSEQSRELAATSQRFSDWMHCAQYFEQIGEKKEAAQVYRSVLSRHGFHWDTFRALFQIEENACFRHSSLLSLKTDRDVLAEARERASLAVRDDPTDASSLRALAALEDCLGYDEQAAILRKRVARIENGSRLVRAEPRIGRILAAASYRLPNGIRRGIIHELECKSVPKSGRGAPTLSITGIVQSDFEQTAQQSFAAAQEFIQANDHEFAVEQCIQSVSDVDYVLRVPLDRFPSGGRSAGITMTVLFISAMLRLPVPQDVAMTGEIQNHGGGLILIKAIADEAYKARGMADKGLRFLILPADNRQFLPLHYDLGLNRLLFVKTLDEALRLKDGDGKPIFGWLSR